jgi:hypothetical protein
VAFIYSGWLRRAIALFVTTLNAATIIQVRVVEGEGMVYPIGSRATRGLTVLVTDATGKPVEGAAVNFRLPDGGPGGAFAGGQRTQLVTTQADGKASVWGMQWNKTPGPFEIRITATKDQARAGLVSTQTLSEAIAPALQAGGTGAFQASHHSRTKWLLIGAAVAGAAAAGFLVIQKEADKTAVPSVVQTQIGVPVITIGHP